MKSFISLLMSGNDCRSYLFFKGSFKTTLWELQVAYFIAAIGVIRLS